MSQVWPNSIFSVFRSSRLTIPAWHCRSSRLLQYRYSANDACSPGPIWSGSMFKNTPISKKIPSTRCILIPCEDTSITQHTHPLLTICANSLCRSLDSGVVCPAFFTSFPLYVHIVPTMPVLYPASFKIPAVRNAVVVFPFVPVIPMILSFFAG